MALCGCFPSCSCQLTVEPPELLTLTGNGDPLSGGWILTALETIFSTSNSDGAIDIIPGGAYGHAPELNLIIEDTDTVDLEVGPSGLSANVRIDPASPTPINVTNDGLYIPAIPTGSGELFPGVVLDYYGPSAPAGWLLCYGQLVNIATYPGLFAAIGHAGSAGVDPGGGQFTIPDLRGRVTVGLDDMGGVDAANISAPNTLGYTDGDEFQQLDENNLPEHTHTEVGSHDHPVSDSGHAHTASSASSGDHNHQPNSSPARAFVTAEVSTLTQVDVNDTAPSNVTRYVAFSSGGATTVALDLGVSHRMVVSGAGADFDTQGQQLNNSFTSTDGAHTHTITVNSATTGVTVGQNTDPVEVGGGGNGSALGNAFSVMQPFQLVNKIIKV